MASVGPDHAVSFRKTRSGAIFSPWGAQVGAPLHAPADFDLETNVRQAIEREDARRARGAEEEDDILQRDGDDQELPPPSTQALASLAILQNMTRSGPPSTPNGGNDTRTKEKYHSANRTKKRRLAKQRAVSERAGATGIAKKTPKQAALKRLQAVEALAASAASDVDVALSLAADAASTSLAGAAPPIPTDYSLAMKDVPVAKTAYVAKRDISADVDKRIYTKEELLAQGFEYIPWNGVDPRTILDKTGRVIAVLVGQPRSENWGGINDEMQTVMELAREAYQAPAKQQDHRRGAFTVATSGISFGGGQTHVKNMAHSSHNQAVMDALLKQLPVIRVAKFGSRALQLFAPQLHDYYEETMQALCNEDDGLVRNFEDVPFANATFNLGPRCVCIPHNDHLNVAWGMCAITAFGDYNPVVSAHLVLWQYRMVVEFPPASTVLIMSAVLTHGNTAIREDEHRYSFTQYSVGGLFRWVDSGHRTVSSLPRVPADRAAEEGAERWKRGVEMLSVWEELKDRAAGH
ncbi:hypothetical protein OH77DRAFT_824378 [Trametes cingulata]|nr:hypothetical protein OH77DRAFT_824378 [Trametes cingulata]